MSRAGLSHHPTLALALGMGMRRLNYYCSRVLETPCVAKIELSSSQAPSRALWGDEPGWERKIRLFVSSPGAGDFCVGEGQPGRGMEGAEGGPSWWVGRLTPLSPSPSPEIPSVAHQDFGRLLLLHLWAA